MPISISHPSFFKTFLPNWPILGALLAFVPALLTQAAETSPSAALLKYEVVKEPWDAKLGSHRAVVRVRDHGPVSTAFLEWRRRDPLPESKGLLVVDAHTNQRVANVLTRNVSNDSGEVVFEPTSGPGEYLIYFLPGDPGSGSFPQARYLPPEQSANTAWLQSSTINPSNSTVIRWETRSEHDRFSDMEIIATSAEKTTWLSKHPDSFFCFVEPAERPVRMFDHVPQQWLLHRSNPTPTTTAGKPLVFQIGLWAARQNLTGVEVKFSDFTSRDHSAQIESTRIKCLQNSGSLKTAGVRVDQGAVGSLWCGLQTAGLQPGRYLGTAEVSATGLPVVRIEVELELSAHHPGSTAITKPEALAKLLWLDSEIGHGGTPQAPFIPLKVEGKAIALLGRLLTLGETGLPAAITSYFDSSVTKIRTVGREILSAPIKFVLVRDDGHELQLKASQFHFTKAEPDVVEWMALLASEEVSMNVHGHIEADGHIELRCELSATRETSLKDIRMEIPRTEDSTVYAMGLGMYGGKAPESIDWHWDAAHKHQDALWLGDVNAGLRVQWRAENYVRPMVNIHYVKQPLKDPPSWSGNGIGGVTLNRATQAVLVSAYSGARVVKPGHSMHFDADLSITPFKTLNTEAQWRDRYYHVGGVPPEPQKVLEQGANIVNIHQGNALNPYINYPFLTADKLHAYGVQAHDAGLRVKHYYTVRELTNWCPELPALRAFGDELLATGRGGGHAWCEEHLSSNYLGAWYSGSTNDASVLTATMSRFHNFYLEGLDWLVKNAACDGIYLDDISYDRTIMKRARRILNQNPRGALIDLHSWNEMNPRAGFASCSLLFMDSFPFIDRLWLGEGHHYDGPPEQTLVGVSGVPFGLMGEMLEGGGNPWLGLTFGMTGRLGWGGSPQSVWKLWDSFGVAGSNFQGWWDRENPVKASHPNCRVSVWRQPGRTLIAVGNFGDQPATTALHIDFKSLDMNKEKALLYAPSMHGFQPELLFNPEAEFAIAPKRGFVFILDETPRKPLPPASKIEPPTSSLLLEDAFTSRLSGDWTTVASMGAELRYDGEGLVFAARAHTHLWVERSLPQNATLVAAQIRQDGADEAQQFGPGLALLWPDGRLLKVCRRKDGRFGLSIAGKEVLEGICDKALPVTLAFKLDKEAIRILASGEGAFQQVQELAVIPRNTFPGNPNRLRLGKMPNSGEAKDNASVGQAGWSRADWIRIYGD